MNSATFAKLLPKFKSAANPQNINKPKCYRFFENENQLFSCGITVGKKLSINLDFENASTAVKCSNSIQGSFNNDRPGCMPWAVFH